MMKRHVKLKDVNENVALGPSINYVLEDTKLGKKKQPPNVMSCVVYIPLTSRYLFPMVAAQCLLLKSYLEVTHDSSMSEFIPLEPLPASDLRIKRSSGEPAKGGLMMSFQSVFCIDVMLTEFAAKTSQVLYAHHLPDEHIMLTPDLYGKLPQGSYPNPGIDASAAHDFYLRELRGSNTVREGCRVYVANSYYCNVC